MRGPRPHRPGTPKAPRKSGPGAFGPDDPDRMVAMLRRLADDLERIASGTGPTLEELDAAPMLGSWRMTERWSIGLAGHVTAHPRLPSGPIMTSELWALQPEEGWARTFSRWYRLGKPQPPEPPPEGSGPSGSGQPRPGQDGPKAPEPTPDPAAEARTPGHTEVSPTVKRTKKIREREDA